MVMGCPLLMAFLAFTVTSPKNRIYQPKKITITLNLKNPKILGLQGEGGYQKSMKKC